MLVLNVAIAIIEPHHVANMNDGIKITYQEFPRIAMRTQRHGKHSSTTHTAAPDSELLAPTTAWHQRIYSKLRNMPEDGSTTQAINTSRFVLSTLKPLQRISLDTTGPMEYPLSSGISDHWHVELFSTKDATATTATDALSTTLISFWHGTRDYGGPWFAIHE